MGLKDAWNARTNNDSSTRGDDVSSKRHGDIPKRHGQKRDKEPDEYDRAIIAYNAAYTDMNDKGLELYHLRERAVDLIQLVEHLVNSIANTPKEFETNFEEVRFERQTFAKSQEFARQKLEAARQSAGGAGAGVAAGVAVASMAPSAALWIATTFGTASTGTAISTLSGAAATNAALAWLGGGALAAGGGGMAAGHAFLAMAGPLGLSIAGVSVLTSVVLFTKKKHDIAAKKQEELRAIKKNTWSLLEATQAIATLLEKTNRLRSNVLKEYQDLIPCYGANYQTLDSDTRFRLGSLVNNTLALAKLLNERIDTNDK